MEKNQSQKNNLKPYALKLLAKLIWETFLISERTDNNDNNKPSDQFNQ